MNYTTVKKALVALEQPERASFAARFFKMKPSQYGESDQFLGLSMPQQHGLAKQFRTLPCQEVELLLREPFHECRMVALLIWVLQIKKADLVYQATVFNAYLKNREFINNWDLVDVTCPHIVGRYLLHHERTVLYNLAHQEHLWSQRMAMVSTIAFIRANQFADTFTLAEVLLSHKHDLIHKAIGWMLREVGKRNAGALEEFLHDHHQSMPRTTLRYAIERFEPHQRRYYLNL